MKENSLPAIFFQPKVSNICWFQLPKCKYLPLFFVIYDGQWRITLQTHYSHVKVSYWDLAKFRKSVHCLKSMINMADMKSAVPAFKLVFDFSYKKGLQRKAISHVIWVFVSGYYKGAVPCEKIYCATRLCCNVNGINVYSFIFLRTNVNHREQKHVKDTKKKKIQNGKWHFSMRNHFLQFLLVLEAFLPQMLNNQLNKNGIRSCVCITLK